MSPFTNGRVAGTKRAGTAGLRRQAAGWRCRLGRTLKLRATRGRCGNAWGRGRGMTAEAAASAPEVAPSPRADGGRGSDDDGGGQRRGRCGPLSLALPRLPGGRAAGRLRGRCLRGPRYRQPDVSPASRAEPGAGPGHAGQRADRWAGRHPPGPHTWARVVRRSPEYEGPCDPIGSPQLSR